MNYKIILRVVFCKGRILLEIENLFFSNFLQRKSIWILIFGLSIVLEGSKRLENFRMIKKVLGLLYVLIVGLFLPFANNRKLYQSISHRTKYPKIKKS